MGFLTGVITGIAVAASAAAWYLSRSGERFRDQYHVEDRLGEIGDQLEARTREIQATVSSQISDMRAKRGDGASTNGHDPAATLGTAEASAAEAAAEAAARADVADLAEAAVDAPTVKVRKPAKGAAKGVAEDTAG